MNRTLMVLMMLSLVRPALADGVRELSWPDLVPPVGALADPLAELPMNVRYDLGFVAKVIADAENDTISAAGPEYLNAMAIMEDLRARGVDVDRLVRAVAERDAEIARRSAEVDPSLDGQIVKMPGYALPLEFSGSGVSEMLLVPYVGACIHVPPPPPNQIIYARLDEAWELESYYEPVWITGRIEVRESNPSLSFVDGQADIETGYAMQVTEIERFE